MVKTYPEVLGQEESISKAGCKYPRTMIEEEARDHEEISKLLDVRIPIVIELRCWRKSVKDREYTPPTLGCSSRKMWQM